MATKVKEETEVTVIDIIEPVAKEFTFVLGEGGDDPITIVQKPLTFFGKIELFSVLSVSLNKVLDKGVSIGELLDVPESDSLPISGDASKEADIFIKSITQVLQYAPEALGDIFCVILAVPRNNRDEFKVRLEEDLSDDQAFAVLNTFVDQNWEILVDFFTGKGLQLFQKISQKLQK